MSITLLPKPILDGIQRSYSISMLWEGTAASTSVSEERQLLNLVLPPWQRDVVWTETQQRSFIEGIFSVSVPATTSSTAVSTRMTLIATCLAGYSTVSNASRQSLAS